MKRIYTKCLVCGKKLNILGWQIKQGRGKYCGRDCYYTFRRGQIISSYSVNCQICGKEIITTPSRAKKGQDKFCSRGCFYEFRKDKKNIPWLIEKGFQKGHKSWNKGTHIQSNTGKTHFKKGDVPWHAGLKGVMPEPWNKGLKGDLRLINAGKRANAVMKNRGYPNRVGKRHSLITRKNISAKKQGIDISEWNGFTMSLNHTLRELPEYQLWQNACFGRDGYTCQKCGSGKRLNVDHRISFAELIQEAIKIYGNDLDLVRKFDKLWDINNGRVLCEGCHKETDNYGWRARWLIERTKDKAEEINFI